jgi:hypothetical protein
MSEPRPPTFEPTKKKAVIITCSDYTDATKLRGCKHDGIAIRDYLEKECLFDDIIFLAESNLQRIEQDYAKLLHLAENASDLNARMLIFFYYSGHGILQGGFTYGVTVTGDKIRLDEMVKDLARCPDVYVIALFDCCREVTKGGSLPSIRESKKFFGQYCIIYTTETQGLASASTAEQLSDGTREFLSYMREKKNSSDEFRQLVAYWPAKIAKRFEVVDTAAAPIYLNPRITTTTTTAATTTTTTSNIFGSISNIFGSFPTIIGSIPNMIGSNRPTPGLVTTENHELTPQKRDELIQTYSQWKSANSFLDLPLDFSPTVSSQHPVTPLWPDIIPTENTLVIIEKNNNSNVLVHQLKNGTDKLFWVDLSTKQVEQPHIIDLQYHDFQLQEKEDGVLSLTLSIMPTLPAEIKTTITNNHPRKSVVVTPPGREPMQVMKAFAHCAMITVRFLPPIPKVRYLDLYGFTLDGTQPRCERVQVN